jgi:hypothetical protein
MTLATAQDVPGRLTALCLGTPNAPLRLIHLLKRFVDFFRRAAVLSTRQAITEAIEIDVLDWGKLGVSLRPGETGPRTWRRLLGPAAEQKAAVCATKAK